MDQPSVGLSSGGNVRGLPRLGRDGSDTSNLGSLASSSFLHHHIPHHHHRVVPRWKPMETVGKFKANTELNGGGELLQASSFVAVYLTNVFPLFVVTYMGICDGNVYIMEHWDGDMEFLCFFSLFLMHFGPTRW